MKHTQFLRVCVIVTIASVFMGSTLVAELYNGTGEDVLLQGFHWESHNYPWYQIIYENTHKIREAGFDYVWFPPPTSTADCEGYLPNQWYDLDTRYGSKDDLIKAIKALKEGNNTETNLPNIRPVLALADIVVNHRCGEKDWADFANPHFAPEGTTDPNKIEEANNAAVCKNDEWEKNKGEPDSGDSFHAGRDLDHANANVQRKINQWLTWLKNDIGFSGWRWDLVKGYHPKYVGIYNDGSQPLLSIGEYWAEDRQAIVDWINRTMGLPDAPSGSPDRTGGKSAAFDFATRELIRKAVMYADYQCLKTPSDKPAGMIGWWGSMSVTFIENHDTETAHRPYLSFPGDRILEGYAYILTHPGKPCVFWRHFFDRGQDTQQAIRELIAVRKKMGIRADSTVHIRTAEKGLYAAIIDKKVAMKIGHNDWTPPGNDWIMATHGNNYAVWTKTP